MPGDAVGQGENSQDGVEAAVGDVQGAVGEVQVVVAVDAAPFIGDGGVRVVAHAAGSGLVLTAAQGEAGGVGLDVLGPAGFGPFGGAGIHISVGAERFRVGRAG